jgi:hypothetical protein
MQREYFKEDQVESEKEPQIYEPVRMPQAKINRTLDRA